MVGMDIVEGVDVVRAGFFVFFRFGCLGNMMGESCDRDCGSCAGVGMMEAVHGVRMGVGVDGVGTRGEGVVSSGGNVCMADGGGGSWKDCSRIFSWKTSHTVSHSWSILAMSFCRLA